MASSGSGYDLSASTFSPDGRLFQVEYASKAVENSGTTVLGICTRDGSVVMGASFISPHRMALPHQASSKRVYALDSHIGLGTAGWTPDARVMAARGMDECVDYKNTYGTPIAGSVLAERLGMYVHYFTLHGALRPFGATGLLAAYNEETSSTSLHLVEPNGSVSQYYGAAAGKGKQAAKTELEKLQLHTSSSACETAEQAVQQVVKILTLLHQEAKENEGKTMQIELGWICADSKWKHVGVPKDVVAQAQTWTQEQLDEEDEEEETMEEG